MNQKQRIAIAIGIILVALCGLVPPYYGERVSTGDNLKANVGYRLIFAPPSPQTVAEAFGYAEVEDYMLPLYHARIATDRVLIQMSTIIVVAIGAVALLAGRKQK